MVPLQPDILVTRAGSPEILLVVQVTGSDGSSGESALRSYMVEMNCPVGMMVTPSHIRFYRNRYIDYLPHNVEMIGECPTGELLGELVRESELERSVEEWLERLQVGTDRMWPPSVREAIESSVVPVVSDGIIRAGGPRWRRAG
jgi:hypothetical protein